MMLYDLIYITYLNFCTQHDFIPVKSCYILQNFVNSTSKHRLDPIEGVPLAGKARSYTNLVKMVYNL